ncbi:DUF4382 domain-containing protein [Haloarcula sp. S1AR25-5A]|uniref:DUF4382 domain-containing protein n=1 Tax=Haloarcula terrestris TaxID=2950533 RepID=A0AAE4EUH2_9EURY|nr:DUF4382 domain-containing protein [Haloarcula terrestris]MDS0220361.1 DUF4382 domain-containing protein [Haloarcula terrestris]
MRRRRFIATGAGVGVGLLAGCSGSSDTGGSDGSSGDGTSTDDTSDSDTTTDDGGAVGAFRLLISDQPAAIGDFDSLDVSFSRARIFHAGGEDTESETEATETAEATETNETATAEATETATAEPTETAEMDDEDQTADADDEETDDDNGFVVRELDGATVDLTEVVGDKAISVLDGELEEGQYSKIELSAESVDGIVDGESVDVKIPSEKLQIVKPFEVVAGESVEFVFDINVVKKGNGGYNLLPVISKSGVAGKDVEVEEVGEGADADDESDDDAEETEVETTDRDSMTESDRRGNETTADE